MSVDGQIRLPRTPDRTDSLDDSRLRAPGRRPLSSHIATAGMIQRKPVASGGVGSGSVQRQSAQAWSQDPYLDAALRGTWPSPVQLRQDNDSSHESVDSNATTAESSGTAGQSDIVPVEQRPDYTEVVEYVQAMTAVENPKSTGQKNGSASKDAMTGIGSDVAVGRFVAEGKNIESEWSKLSANQRATKLAKAANDELESIDVLKTTAAIKNMSDAGQFDFQTWQLDLGKEAFSKAKPSKAEIADMADTVYHETRHCEQWHRMARLRAGEGKTADEIKTEMYIPKKAADHAHARPLKGTGKAVTEAKDWYKNIYGSGRTARNKVLTEVSAATTAYQSAINAESKLSATATKKQRDAAAKKTKEAKVRYDKAMTAYKNLAEEADAWKVAGKVKAKMEK